MSTGGVNDSVEIQKQAPSSSIKDSNGSDLLEILEIWKQFDIEGVKTRLEKSCVEMREMKTGSIAGRKRLNDLTKAFRSNSSTTGANTSLSVTDLLKAYQEEIDQLSRRSKLSETAFFALLKSLHDLPGDML